MNPYDLILLAICLWREARGEMYETKVAVACTIRNRVNNPRWWGHSWNGVVLLPYQYSSFNHGDPNATKWPVPTDPAWVDSLAIATGMLDNSIADTTQGATSYFDDSMAQNPPEWAATMTKTMTSGRINFYRLT